MVEGRMWAPVVLWGIIVFGCSDDWDKHVCKSNSDCPNESYCHANGACASDCQKNSDCSAGEKCSAIGTCVAEAKKDGGPLKYDTGGGIECTSGETKCTSSSAYASLKQCISGSWTTSSCNSLCTAAGYAAASSCSYDSSKGKDICYCYECKTGQNKCTDSSASASLKECLNGSWSTSSCSIFCYNANHGPPTGCSYLSSKGQDSCVCNIINFCSASERKCIGSGSSSYLWSCSSSGYWTTDSCSTLCVKNGYSSATGCSYDLTVGAYTCNCS